MRILKHVRLGPHHRPTGKSRHFDGGELLPVPALLLIAKCAGDPGCYLLYCDAEGKELTDTYHETVDSAMKQADFEFNVHENDWAEGP